MKALQVLLLIALSSGIAEGQYIKNTDGKDYYVVDDSLVNYKDMADIFNTNANAYKYYTKSLRNKRVAKSLGYTTVGAASLGLLALVINPSAPDDMYCDLFCLSFGQGIFLVSYLFVVPISGTLALGHKFAERRKRKKAINIINGETIDLGYSSQSYEIKATMAANGIGFSLSF